MACDHSPEFSCVECNDRASVETPLQVRDGDWVVPSPQQGFLWGCCDCGLMHSVDFRIEDGQVEMRVYRDEAQTRTLRMKMARALEPSEPTDPDEWKRFCVNHEGYSGATRNCPTCVGGSNGR